MVRRPGGPSLFQRGARSALADNLVEQPRGLPGFRAQAGGVGTPPALPGLIPFGGVPPGFAQSSRFTGGTVPSPLSLTRGDQTPSFTEPSYGGGAPVMPTPAVRGMSPLTQALASASTLPPAPTGGTATPQLPPPTQRAEAGPGILGLPGAGTPARSVALAGGGGGYQAPSPLAAINQQGQAPPQAQPSAGLSALIAALAQRGQKVSPGGGLFQKAF